ncbi:cation transporter dimerization domain-containing protein [Mesorhizobium sp. ES1-3]|uniref:cation transporter dimerization domain-containing protein n=1 Tax=Mesorhizobium sp. ES1-3 TaxID=2876628 RepID=UPI001CCAB5DD|nr:cation transporter dimerization domain-containing protein [Mesorhizobium sp. ES1-3]MBZ9673645.1 hypothetical protein [Mesorhizobium sp. ES1-3]
MESVPADLDFDDLVGQIEAIEGVENLHHVHVWRPDDTRRALEAHIAVSERDLESADRLKDRIKQMLSERFDIAHAMLEVEFAPNVSHDRNLIRKE